MGFLQKFMYGRYGADALGSFTLVLYLAFWLLGAVTGWWVVHLFATLLAFVTLYRMLSRNISRRRAENQRFLTVTAPIRGWWRSAKLRRTDKTHKYFKCPNCGQQLRVPKGAGRIKVTCRSCGTSFEENS